MSESLVPVRPEAALERSARQLPESIRRVLESRTFERAPTLRTLLTYLWENRHKPISEYAIATEALGRSPSFDAKTDATVRVQISRLRQRLEKFYEQEGKDCCERIVIPLGAHQATVETAPVAEVLPPPPILRAEPHTMDRRLVWFCSVLVILCAGLGLALYRAQRAARASAPESAPRFWRTFFGNGRPTRIILPTPVFFAYHGPENTTLMVRDTVVNEFADRGRSVISGDLDSRFGPPSLAQNYTVASDTFASVRLVRYLDRFSLSPRVRGSADGPVDALESENVIAVGTWGTLTPLKPYLDRMSFRLLPNERTVEIRGGRAGEPNHIDAIDESTERGIWPGIVAVLPGPAARTHLLILASRHTSALVYTLTSANGLEMIDRLWQSKGSPEFFEMVVKSEMNGMDMVRSWPVLIRPFAPKGGVTASN